MSSRLLFQGSRVFVGREARKEHGSQSTAGDYRVIATRIHSFIPHAKPKTLTLNPILQGSIPLLISKPEVNRKFRFYRIRVQAPKSGELGSRV